ncbi:FliH/SctL family protein [Hahella ganghwensis]|uniref:FliH/SctL family protein n=1 Tax=Hahella ganghwensis TaxID=286420 RepID=UPI000372754F|nr:FliH/SctL family protein [Hahella ganghwensis]
MIRLIESGMWQVNAQGRRIPAGESESILQACEYLQFAKSVHADSMEEAERIKREAYREGFQSGLEQSRTDVYKEVLEAKNRIRKQAIDQEQQVMKLSLTIVRKILPRLSSEEVLKSLLQEALAELQNERQLQIFVRPDLVEFAESWLQQWRKEHPDILRMDIVGDPELGAFGCRVETELGTLVADPMRDIQELAEKVDHGY